MYNQSNNSQNTRPTIYYGVYIILCNVIAIIVCIPLILIIIFGQSSRHNCIQVKNEFVTSDTARVHITIENSNMIYQCFLQYGPAVNKYQFDSKNINIEGSGSIVITDLKPNTQYFYIAVVQKLNKASIWNNFTTLPEPNVVAITANNITNDSVIMMGNITNYGSDYLYYKFMLRALGSPNWYSLNTKLAKPYGTHIYTDTFIGLSASYTYFFKIVAFEEFNDNRVYESKSISFNTLQD